MELKITDELKEIYIYRINRVIDYINDNIDLDLSLKTLAEVSGFSEFYFHRIFKSLVGETLKDFIRRKRVERGAYLLKSNESLPITEVALECGFSSSSNFAREFKKYFKLEPREYRKIENSQKDYSKSKNCIEMIKNSSYTYIVDTGINEARVKVFQDMDVIYVRHIGGYQKKELDATWDKIINIANIYKLIDKNTTYISISYDDPRIASNVIMRFDACVSIDKRKINSKMILNTMVIKGGVYAVFSYSGKYWNLENAYEWIYKSWFPKSGYEPDNRVIFNIDRKVNSGDDLFIDICIPAKKLP